MEEWRIYVPASASWSWGKSAAPRSASHQSCASSHPPSCPSTSWNVYLHWCAMNKNPTSLKDLKTCRQGRPLGWQGQLLRHRHPAAQPTRLEHIGQDWSDIVKLKISTDVAVCSLCERSTKKNYERSDTAQLLWIPNSLTYRSFYLSVNAIKPGIFQKLVKLHSILCNNTWHLFISSGEAPWGVFDGRHQLL